MCVFAKRIPKRRNECHLKCGSEVCDEKSELNRDFWRRLPDEWLPGTRLSAHLDRCDKVGPTMPGEGLSEREMWTGSYFSHNYHCWAQKIFITIIIIYGLICASNDLSLGLVFQTPSVSLRSLSGLSPVPLQYL